jgi:hypothetical protein
MSADPLMLPWKYRPVDYRKHSGDLSWYDYSYQNVRSHALTTLNLKNCRIECTCDLTWISKQLNGTRIIFEGTCETIEKPISLYIKDRVPTCPAR